MRKLSAHYIYTAESQPLKKGILVLSDDGEVLEIIDTGGKLRETAGLEFYNGILVPGFINAHCHLELSHLKSVLDSDCGLPDFIKHVADKKQQDPKVVQEAMIRADRLMQRNGIVAVGDISNTDDSFGIKKQSKIFYHSFIELFGLNPEKARQIVDSGLSLIRSLSDHQLEGSICLHSAYSSSQELIDLVSAELAQSGSIHSFHNQESIHETEFFLNGRGPMFDFLSSRVKPEFLAHMKGKNSFHFISTLLPSRNPVLLVHNTYTTSDDIRLITERFENPFLVICPSSNLFIENRLPDIPLLRDSGILLTVGTDSLASNDNLDILHELSLIQDHFPEISLEELLTWATLNGAKALGIDSRYGSFRPGKHPGVVLIENSDLEKGLLTRKSKATPLY